MSAYFTGRGETWVTMVVSFIACAVNVLLDYLFIFDIVPLGIPGIAGRLGHDPCAVEGGGGVRTVDVSPNRHRERKYGLLLGWQFDWGIDAATGLLWRQQRTADGDRGEWFHTVGNLRGQTWRSGVGSHHVGVQ